MISHIFVLLILSSFILNAQSTYYGGKEQILLSASKKIDIPQTTTNSYLKKETSSLNDKTPENQQNLLIDQLEPQTEQEQQTVDSMEHIIPEQQLHEESHYHKPSDPQFWWNLLLAAGTFHKYFLVLTITGAFCSGMGVGFCNIDKLQLQVMTMSNDPNQKKMAKTIHEVVSNHHLWLVTLLVYNAVALQSLPLVVHTLMPDWAAILFSTIIVLIAAQIVPQAICTGPKKMILAYYAAPIVTIMRKMLFFIVHPIAKGLDLLLGVHNHERIQHKDFANFLTGNKILKQTQKMILTSTLELRCQRVLQKMIPIKKLYMFECSQILTKQKVDEMLKNDFSHVLVYKDTKDSIVGVIKVKEFALKYLRSNEKKSKAEQFIDTRSPLLSVYKDTNLLEMLMLFQANSKRIAFVCDQKRKTALDIPSIMYTKNDMIINKKGAKIIGAIFLYQIFDELTDLKENVPQQSSAQKGEQTEMKELKGLQEPLIDKH